MKRIIVFGLVAALVWAVEDFWLAACQPQISSSLAVRQLNGGTPVATRLREFEALKDSIHVLCGSVIVIAGLGCFAPWIQRGAQAIRRRLGGTRLGRLFNGSALVGLSALLLTGGCMRPFDRPEYVEIDTSETGFLIPLE